MTIITTTINDAGLIAGIVSEANKDVAKLFSINRENAPKHTSFCTTDWVLSGMERGEEYFLYIKGGKPIGCVAFELADSETAYLNRLGVLTDFRHKGIGADLVKYIINYAESKKVQTLSIGIIAAHEVLKSWYKALGFNEIGTQQFEHLPFDVLYMSYQF